MVRQKSPTSKALQALVSKIPAKTLHAYVLAHLPTAPPATLTALASFFATLTPPTLLHCVRCHSGYIEVENDDRSCYVPHDGDSANMERAMDRYGNEYVTEYGCCGATVNGDGDDGPPDSWCYEGMHTTDVKRARFRDDSTSDNDMLESCIELNCHIIRAPPPDPRPRVGSSTDSVRVKRAPPPPVDLADSDDDDDDDEDDNASRFTEDSPVVAEIVRGVSAMKQKTVGQRRTNATVRKVSAGTLAQAHIASRGTSGAESSETGKVRAPPASTPAARTPAPAEGKVRKRRKVAGAA